MAYFAKLNPEKIVIRVSSVNNNVLLDNGIESEEKGIQFLKKLYNEPNALWKQTSYNTFNGVHSFGKIPLRKNYASIGYTYDENRDAFIPPKMYNSWTLNENTCDWDAPIPYPTILTFGDNIPYLIYWNEEGQKWIGKDDQNNEFQWIPSSSSWVATGN